MRIAFTVLIVVMMMLTGCLPGTWQGRSTVYEYQPSTDRLSLEYAVRGRYVPDAIVVSVTETIYAEQMERSVSVEEEHKSLFQQAPVLPIGVGVAGYYLTAAAYDSYKEAHDKWRNDPWRTEEDEPSAWLPAIVIVATGAAIIGSFNTHPTGKTRESTSDWYPTNRKALVEESNGKGKKVIVTLADNARDVLAVDGEFITGDDGTVKIPVKIVHRDYISESSSKWESPTLRNTHEEFFYATVSLPEENVTYDLRLGPFKNINIFNK